MNTIRSIITRTFNLLMSAVTLISGLLFAGQTPSGAMPSPAPGAHTQYVNPFIGTGAVPWASGMTFPGAAAPFGTVRLSPDTCFPFGVNIHNMGTGGYWYGKGYAYGFSHTRVSGAGLIEGGLFRVTPGIGKANPIKRMSQPLPFSHDAEVALPGYYAVRLPKAACLAELTATEHTGVHRYTFSSTKDAHLFLDATSLLGDGRGETGAVRVLDDRTVEGELGGRAFFRAVFDTPFTATPWRDGKLLPGQTESAGLDAGVDLNFGNRKDAPITLHLGFSYISAAEAANNLQEESAGDAFDRVYEKTRGVWEERLSSIELQTSDDEVRRIFYTALYHTMIHPTNMTDASGKYLGFGKQIGTAEGYTYRSDLSLWDTFRTTHPLYALIAPDIQRDSVQSLLRMAEQYGGFPRWPKLGGEGGSMYGNPAHIVLAESYLKGLMSQADAETALDVMKQTVFGTVPEGFPYRGRDNGAEYLALGYVPSELQRTSVSRTLEYAWADYAASLMADKLGREEDAAAFWDLSQNFRNVFDPSVKYFRPRNAAGQWSTYFSPYSTTYYDEALPVKLANGFSEGSARHYRWHAVQDPQGLIDLMGGADYFVKELDKFMKDASLTRAAIDPGDGWWVGNQHNYHAPYMFNEAGRPDLTQKWVRWTLTERFADSPDGLDGNDDLGALSAWYIFSALGFFPVAGTDRYWLGAPLVDEAVLKLEGGKTLTIKAVNQSAKNIYVSGVTLNGAAVSGTSITHDQIKDGGTLVFTMAARVS